MRSFPRDKIAGPGIRGGGLNSIHEKFLVQLALHICTFLPPEVGKQQGKKFQRNPKKQNLNLPCDRHYSYCNYNYLHSICMVLGIINNQEMISSIQEDVCRLYANAMQFFVRDLNWIWISTGVLKPNPHPPKYGRTTVPLNIMPAIQERGVTFPGSRIFQCSPPGRNDTFPRQLPLLPTHPPTEISLEETKETEPSPGHTSPSQSGELELPAKPN